MLVVSLDEPALSGASDARWALVYATVDAPLGVTLDSSTRRVRARRLGQGIRRRCTSRARAVRAALRPTRVLSGTSALPEGFVLVGFASDHDVHGSFVAGYTPTARRGRVTSATGRRVVTIDKRPAAQVYNEWLDGALSDVMPAGGNVLARTTMHPLGRMIDKVGQVPRYLLSHPHQIHEDGSLSFFTDLALGDELSLMLGSDDALLDRTDQVAARAGRGAGALRGGILIYCAGCVGAIGDKTPRVAERFSQRVHQAPFIGASTYGEQGCFLGSTTKNRHGNLMCDAILFE
ncbi:MAG: FIST C-terminal domain-containing protein [Polyangiaceae bacterium]|nr:FIST C-terminal domain-containing protein [Polyangiaceae bacterium]MBK8936336.1 FIST C-terminal domain-containing protein [Polyangiaceae bacterium]